MSELYKRHKDHPENERVAHTDGRTIRRVRAEQNAEKTVYTQEAYQDEILDRLKRYLGIRNRSFQELDLSSQNESVSKEQGTKQTSIKNHTDRR